MCKAEKVNYAAVLMWARFSPRRIVFLLRINWRHWRANRRRRRQQRQIDGSVPSVLAISPTMRCNYNCKACYSRGRPTDDELSTDELDALFSEAEEVKRCRSGFVHVVLFLRPDCISDKIGLKGYLKIGLVPCGTQSAHELQ